MAVKKAAKPEIYQLKVTLRGTRPPVWRRLLVPADLTLARLHDVLQVAMGWENYHLHEFRVGARCFGEPREDDGLFGGPAKEDERKVRLSDILGGVGAKAVYTYDFGDDWEHDLLLEKRLPPDPGRAYPACVGGKRCCPPEDCGGAGGFFHFLEAMADPAHEQHEELRDWAGEDYDPAAFSQEVVNVMLARFQGTPGRA